MTSGGVGQDAVGQVLAVWRATRQASLVRRFRHGSGGTSLVSLDHHTLVLKAWPFDAPTTANLPSALGRMETMRQRRVPIPEVLEHGELAGTYYLLYEYLPGRWPPRLSARLLDDMIAVVDAERGAGEAPAPDWQASLAGMVGTGDPLFDIAPAVVAAHPLGLALLAEARRRLERCDPDHFSTADVLHGDFAPENVLADHGRLVGVVDWERCRIGDAGLDLVGVLFDSDGGNKASPAVRRRLWSALIERVPPDVLALYVALYAVRYASWAINSPMEHDVLALGTRLVQESVESDHGRRGTVTRTFATIDDYIGTFPDDVRAILDEVRRAIRKAAPAAQETISYQIPTFTLNGRRLVSFAVWKHHVSLYQLPAVDEAVERELAPYRAAKSTARFPLGKPIPYDLVECLVALRVEQQANREK
jgi:uncharacterized protein YdhG (YjbR/CyaY superfamily)/aminoglycoside phosphotransferase